MITNLNSECWWLALFSVTKWLTLCFVPTYSLMYELLSQDPEAFFHKCLPSVDYEKSCFFSYSTWKMSLRTFDGGFQDERNGGVERDANSNLGWPHDWEEFKQSFQIVAMCLLTSHIQQLPDSSGSVCGQPAGECLAYCPCSVRSKTKAKRTVVRLHRAQLLLLLTSLTDAVFSPNALLLVLD